MLTATAISLIAVWMLALYFSLTLGGWIHLLPIAAAPLLAARFTRREVEAMAFTKWKTGRSRRGGRS